MHYMHYVIAPLNQEWNPKQKPTRNCMSCNDVRALCCTPRCADPAVAQFIGQWPGPQRMVHLTSVDERLTFVLCCCSCCCRFVNVEAVPETADIINRYEQVTLFRAHRHLVQPGAQPYR
jgi:hypothetical protein